jgi:hypothetical protein
MRWRFIYYLQMKMPFVRLRFKRALLITVSAFGSFLVIWVVPRHGKIINRSRLNAQRAKYGARV